MRWNWQQDDWREFRYEAESLRGFEREFLELCGRVWGASEHLDEGETEVLRVGLLRDEAFENARIEDEFLDRASIQASIRRQFGLDSKVVGDREEGMGQLMGEVYFRFGDELSHEVLWRMHGMLFLGGEGAGEYRSHSEPMQIVSGALYQPKVHYEAPPSERVRGEMDFFIEWYNLAHAEGKLGPLELAAVAHLWFESIHPFEDGNGRIVRALVLMSLSRSRGRPVLVSLSEAIEGRRKRYYAALESGSLGNEISGWIGYFVPLLLDAQRLSLAKVDFVVRKGRFYDRFGGDLNERQLKAVERIFREGVKGFDGGLSAGNYMRVTGATASTATRDLKDMVERGVMERRGERKHARYWLRVG